MHYSRQRKVILEVVKSINNHPTAEMVYKESKEKLDSIGIATVYRNLKALSEKGDIRRIKSLDGKDYFDGMLEEHYHARCRECGALTNIYITDEKVLEKAKIALESVFGFDAKDIELENILFNHICSDCKKTL